MATTSLGDCNSFRARMNDVIAGKANDQPLLRS
jgi:hypothetical protein